LKGSILDFPFVEDMRRVVFCNFSFGFSPDKQIRIYANFRLAFRRMNK
jgi:hypothetical protein